LADRPMIRIAIRLLGPLRPGAGDIPSLPLDCGATVADAVSRIEKTRPELGECLTQQLTRESTQVLVNGRHLPPTSAMATVLQDEDVVSFLPPIPGG